jgi:hypothetical protein
MVEKSSVFEEKVRQKGFFSFSGLYDFCFEWLKDEGYKISEDKYTEKIKGEAKDIEVKWTALKKVTDYFKNEIKITFRIWALTDAEIEVGGKKQKTNNGDITITIKASLERDYEGKWEKSAQYKFFRGIYDRYIIRTTIDEYEDNLEEKAEKLTNEIKAFLALEVKR